MNYFDNNGCHKSVLKINVDALMKALINHYSVVAMIAFSCGIARSMLHAIELT